MNINELSPRNFALLLLAADNRPPRQRARDQQADHTGRRLKRQVLERLEAADPEAADLEATLMQIVVEMGPPTGPTRAVAISVWEEWQAANANHDLIAHWLDTAVTSGTNTVRQRSDCDDSLTGISRRRRP